MTNKEVKTNGALDAEQKYEISDTVFIVRPVFKSEGEETLADILFNLMKSELEAN